MSEKEILLPENLNDALVQRVEIWNFFDKSHQYAEKIQGFEEFTDGKKMTVTDGVHAVIQPNENLVDRLNEIMGAASTQSELITKSRTELNECNKQISDAEKARRNMIILLIFIACLIAFFLVISLAGRVR